MFPEIDKEKTGDRIRFFMEIYCLSILFQVPIDAMVCGKATSVRKEHTDICTKRVFGYYKKIRNHAAA